MEQRDKWGLALGRSPTRGNLVVPLIDGPETFRAIHAALETATGPSHFIYILAWWLDDQVPLVSGNAESTLDKVLARKAARGVQVRAMMWVQSPISGEGAHDTPEQIGKLFSLKLAAEESESRILDLVEDPAKVESLRDSPAWKHRQIAQRINSLPGGAAIIDWMTPRVAGSHHQKLVCVRGTKGVIGFCGGVDVNEDRIKVKLKNRGEPLHDVHCEVRGPATVDLVARFVHRWDGHPDAKTFESRGELLGRAVVHQEPRDHGLTARVISTMNDVSSGKFDPRREACQADRSVRDCLIEAIRASTVFIYFEDQYMVSEVIAEALAMALPKVQGVIALIADSEINTMPQVWERRKRFIAIATRNGALKDKFKVYYLYDNKFDRYGEFCYVHSKCWFFDDEAFYIGSANMNRRGLSSDSEVGIFCRSDEKVDSGKYNLAKSTRIRLWEHHLGVRVISPFGEESDKAWANRKEPSRVRCYEPDRGRDVWLPDKTREEIWDRLVDPTADDFAKCGFTIQRRV